MTQDVTESLAPEWSYPMMSDEIGNKLQNIQIDADEEQRRALARRLGVDSVKEAQAKLTIRRDSGNMVIFVKGTVQASMVQNCVVTLEPIDTQIEEEFEAWYADPGQAVSFVKARQQMMAQQQGEETPILDEKDDPEAIVDGVVDLGELATQYLCLGIDPYPHAEGVHYEVGDDTPPDPASDIRKNPFEKLKDWKGKV